MFSLPLPASEKIVIDYDTKQRGELNKNQYEDIMNQLLDVDMSVLYRRILIFDNADENHDGYIDLTELPNLRYSMELEIKRTGNAIGLHTIDHIVKHFNMNGNGNFNFLDINKYMADLKMNFGP